MQSGRLGSLAVISMAMLFAASSVEAQDVVAGSFDQLRLKAVHLGDTVTLTDGAGHETQGKLAELTPSTLTLLVDGARRDFAESDVFRLTHSHNQAGRGAKWGLVLGAAAGAVGSVTFIAAHGGCEPECLAAYLGGSTAYGAGIGAGVGALFGLATSKTDVLYSRSDRHVPRVALAPVVGRERKGVSVAFAF